MNTIYPRNLKKRAATLVKRTPSFQKLVLIHGAISFGVVLAVYAIQVLLNLVTTNQSGLDGIGTSALFKTATSTLSVICNLLLPFWEVGILYAAIRVTRRQDTDFSDLTRGFRRWGAVLRFYLLIIVAFILIFMLLTNALSIVLGILMPFYLILFPMPDSVSSSMEAFEKQLMDMANMEDPTAILQMFPKDVLIYVLPMIILMLLISFVVTFHLYYRIRMSQYLLMDDPAMGAMAAVMISNQMTKGNKWNLLKLDLSIWWYYLLQFLISSIVWIPDILSFTGISLPLSPNTAFLLFQAITAIASIGLLWLFGARVQAIYACAYDVLRTPPQTITVQND